MAGRSNERMRQKKKALKLSDMAAATTRLKIKVVPGASRSEISGWLGDVLKVRVTAPPEKGKANKAVEVLLAQALGLPEAALRIVSGSTAQRKTVIVEGVSGDEVLRRLSVDGRKCTN